MDAMDPTSRNLSRAARYLAPLAAIAFFSLTGGCEGADRTPVSLEDLVEACPDVSANLVEDGGFESPVVQSQEYDPIVAGGNLEAWSVDGGAVDLISSRFWQPARGKQSLDLDGSCGVGSISQQLRTIAGQDYQLCFALTGNPGGPPAIKSLEIWWGDQRVDSLTVDVSFSTFKRMGWTYVHYRVTASADSVVLSFRSTTPGCYGPVLDDVKVQKMESQILMREPTWTIYPPRAPARIPS